MIEELATPAETDCFGRRLAAALAASKQGAVLHLVGELGAGKTALARAVITALGHSGIVVSPSYTLVETYELADRRLHHLDLYRVADPQELEFLGVRELAAQRDFVLIEWADNGAGFLPPCDLEIDIAYSGCGRRLCAAGLSPHGRAIVAQLRGSSIGNICPGCL